MRDALGAGAAGDLVDIATCAKADPAALEIAVNGRGEAALETAIDAYRERDAECAREATGFTGIAEGLEPVIAHPGEYAANAIIDAKYERVIIRTRNSEAEIETATRAGSRTRRFYNADTLRAGVEREGFNAFLRAQHQNPAAVLAATVDAMWTRRTRQILAATPRRLRRKRAELPAVNWSLK
ncbi:MAG: hypothetical protein OXG72_12905 [Acidobacteria bacterium]|nr:hypothetical protein [Acidobacteriota bacterium]